MKLYSLIVLVGLSIACGKNEGSKSSSANGDETQTPEVTPVALPANSLGVNIVEDQVNRTVSISIPAKKTYNPTVFVNGWAYISQASTLILPASLPVVQGRPGNHLSIVTFTIASGISLKCIYLGQGNNTGAEYNSPAKSYNFDFCVQDSVAVSPGNRAALKASPQNILDSSERISTPISLERGDKIEVSVNNSNRNGSLNITGEIQPVFNVAL
jgi:hypothetical protein